MNNQNKYHTDFLTANSFVIGMGSVFNITGDYYRYNSCETAEEADGLALANDWHMVGQDIKDAITVFENSNQKQLALPFID